MTVYSTGGFAQGGNVGYAPSYTADTYLGNIMQLGYTGCFRTPNMSSSSSAAGTSDFLTVYSSGHWGQQTIFDISLITTYYRPSIITWRCCLNYATLMIHQIQEGGHGGADSNSMFLPYSGSPELIIHNDADSSTAVFGKDSSDDNTSGYRDQVSSGGHSGQSVFKQNFRMKANGPYYQMHALIKIYAGGGSSTCFFSNSTVSNVDSNRGSNGSGFHLKTISYDSDYHSAANAS